MEYGTLKLKGGWVKIRSGACLRAFNHSSI